MHELFSLTFLFQTLGTWLEIVREIPRQNLRPAQNQMKACALLSLWNQIGLHLFLKAQNSWRSLFGRLFPRIQNVVDFFYIQDLA